MKRIYEELKNHLENTPKEQLDKEFKEIEDEYGNIGPDALEYIEYVQQNFIQDKSSTR